jgi:hypothetical protein
MTDEEKLDIEKIASYKHTFIFLKTTRREWDDDVRKFLVYLAKKELKDAVGSERRKEPH